jgi:hypothetical protein
LHFPLLSNFFILKNIEGTSLTEIGGLASTSTAKSYSYAARQLFCSAPPIRLKLTDDAKDAAYF